jgi:hypothetical protein
MAETITEATKAAIGVATMAAPAGRSMSGEITRPRT